ncbi:hypothetical protein HDE_03241 [Halotydeus destructor]|nr:hypothetical protein HDE_03241 [Halotydeus destructor]
MQLRGSSVGQSCCCFVITSLLITLTVAQPTLQLGAGSSEEDPKRAGHTIMRFGRTTGHNIMRFGRAGHNIMHFGKRAGLDSSLLQPELGAATGPLVPLYGPGVPEVAESGSDGLAVDYPQFLYTPYRKFNYNYNKKADNRDNVFMHFG